MGMHRLVSLRWYWRPFRRMNDESIVPSRFTVTGVLSVFVVMRDLNNGRIIHGFAMKMGMI